DAETAFRESTRVWRKLITDVTFVDTLAALMGLYRALQEQGNYREAELFCSEALALAEANLPVGHRQVWLNQNNLASLLDKQGLLDRSAAAYQKAFEDSKRATTPDRLQVAVAQFRYGRELVKLHRFAEAETTLLEAQEAFRSEKSASRDQRAASIRA